VSITARVVGAFAVALIAALVATPVARRIALARGIVCNPTRRGVHRDPVPYLGGLAILVSVVLGGLFCPFSPKLLGVGLAAVIITAVGAADDIADLRAWRKLLLSVAAATILVPFGVVVEGIAVPGHGFVGFDVFAVTATIVWVVGLVHASNLMDGMDGEAAGLTAIAASAFLVLGLMWLRVDSPVAPHEDLALVAVMSAAVVGACLGFLRHNFHPARIFMGDAGSQLLGLLLAALAIIGLFKTVLLCVVPVIVLGLQIADTVWAIVRRKLAGRPAFAPDRGHVHHRLLDMGFSQRGAVLMLYAIAVGLAVLAIHLGSPMP